MANFKFSLGSTKYDNHPAQRTAADFDDFVSQLSQTGSTRKGQVFFCAPLASGQHTDPNKNPGEGHWRIHQLALPRKFLALDGDYFADHAVFVSFQKFVARWNSLIYTTASHTTSAPRGRAVIELSRSVDRAEGIALGDAVQRMLIAALGNANIMLDDSVYRAEQPVYVPLVGAEIYRNKGQPLDVDAVLVAYPAQIPALPWHMSITASHQAHLSPVMAALLLPPENPTEIAKVQAALALVSADSSYPDWIEILFSLHSTGWNCAETLARGWSMSAPQRYNSDVFDSVWQNARPLGGITIATLYHRAKQARPALHSRW